jgi:hypothetical protein
LVRSNDPCLGTDRPSALVCNRMQQSEVSGMICVRSQVLTRKARGRLIAALLLASVGWISTPCAQAGCSHSVTTKANAPPFRTVHLELLLQVGASSDDSTGNVPLNVPFTPPCAGFRCSGNSIPATPASITEAAPRSDAWNRSELGTLAMRGNSTRFPINDDTSCSADRVERLSRPPR